MWCYFVELLSYHCMENICTKIFQFSLFTERHSMQVLMVMRVSKQRQNVIFEQTVPLKACPSATGYLFVIFSNVFMLVCMYVKIVLRNTKPIPTLRLVLFLSVFSNSELTLVIKHNRRLAREPFGWFYVNVNDFHAITNKKQCLQCLQELSACDVLWSFSTFRSCWTVLACQSAHLGNLGHPDVSLGLHETLCKPFKYFQMTCAEMKNFSFKSLKTLCQIDLNIHLSAHNRWSHLSCVTRDIYVFILQCFRHKRFPVSPTKSHH